MKKTSLFIFTIIVAFIILTACQATPMKPAVVQKDMQQMIEKAQQTSTYEDPDKHSLKEKLNVPDTLKEELKSVKGKLKIHVNAGISVPDAEGMPAATIGIGKFTDEDVQRLYRTLCGNALPIAENTQITQGFKMRSIQSLLDQKKSGKLDSTKYDSMSELDAVIKKAMREASNLPQHFKRAEPDFSFKANADGTKTVHLRAAPDDITISDLDIMNCTNAPWQSRAEYFRDINTRPDSILASGSCISTDTDSPYYVAPSMRVDTARKLASDTVSALGQKDFVCSGSRTDTLYDPLNNAEDAPRKGVYEYMFTRKIGGVAITYTNDDGNEFAGSSDKDKSRVLSYAAPWMYEKLRIIIDDKGILCLVWNSPYVVTNMVTNSSAMLPFVNIQNTFEKMIPVVGNIYDTSDQGLTCDLYVTQVRLGLMRVTEKNIGTSGLVIPVWDFMGYTKDTVNGINGKDGYRSMLTINAVDGSIIDRGLGY